MRLTPYKKEEMHNIGGYKKTEMQMLLEEFAESDLDCAKVEGWAHKNASSCMSSFRSAINRYKMTGIRCMVRNKEVYLIKETKN